MMYRVLPLFLVALALVAFVSAPALAEKNAGDSHEGKVVSATGNKLVMTDKDGKEHTHTLAENAKVMVDGRAGKTADLRPGMRIRVTTKKGDANMALRVEAIDKNADFGKSGGGTTEKK